MNTKEGPPTGDSGVTSTDTSHLDRAKGGYTGADGDRHDSNGAINPKATVVVGDDIDQNCDGVDPRSFSLVTAGRSHCCAVETNSGAFACWGLDSSGAP